MLPGINKTLAQSITPWYSFISCAPQTEIKADMEWINTFRDSEIGKNLAEQLKEMKPGPARIMEVCGTHTVSIAHNGIRELMPPGIELTSGPGCPVCVTDTSEIDLFINAARRKDTIITTFGDLIKVPGSSSTLKAEKANGADIRVVYSPLDAVEIARQNGSEEVVFLGIGFETTTPTIAAAIIQAERSGVHNFSVISAHKLMPPALEALVADDEIKIDGLLCPGHVSIIIGANAYEPLVAQYGIPCVIAGFEAVDILHGILRLVDQIDHHRAEVEISYDRAVYRHANATALDIMYRVFRPVPALWRGLGQIPASGLKIRKEYQEFDAEQKLGLERSQSSQKTACQCGKVLKGIINPSQCPLFGTACRPDKPIGPCMVSSEGACAALYRYGR
jgi:hydrogenase expression/formation protein HypD